jgi:hypothetical protein
MNNVTLVHAAVHPSLWSDEQDNEKIEQYALYGERDQNSNGKFKRVHNWIDQVPKNRIVFVGHNFLHNYPMVKTGNKGGEVVFLDTGSSKGGYLSSADLKFSKTDLKLECFKRY